MTYTRRTITALQGIEKHTASLDAHSVVALEYCTAWASRHGRLRPVPAVVVRRALQLLAGHLSNAKDPVDIRSELVALSAAGKGSGTARSLTEARARFEEHNECPARQPMDSWLDALYPKEKRAESRALLASLEAHMAGAAR